MPKQKDLKRLVRTRMKKTGESYTTARAQLVRKKANSKAARPAAADYARLAGMSDAAISAKTGRTWKQWVRVLDAIDAVEMPHRDIARHVHDVHDIPAWWAQTVTVGYERIRGLREIGQRRSGTYEANKSKTLNVPVAKLYRAFSDAATRRRWLPGVKVTVRTAIRDKSMRVSWPDGTRVEFYFVKKGDAKSQVAVQHVKLASRADADRAKAFWAERLAALGQELAPRR